MAIAEFHTSSSASRSVSTSLKISTCVKSNFTSKRSECSSCLCTAIYTVHCTCCVSTGSKPAEEGEKVDKPMYLRDYERKQLLERGAMAGVSDSEEEEEQKKVRKSVLCAACGREQAG